MPTMKPIPILVEYGGDGNPRITEVYRDNDGWQPSVWRIHASISRLRKLRARGYTAVSVEIPGRDTTADFSIRALLTSAEGA